MAADMAAQPRSDELLNQSPPYVDVDLYTSDQPLRSAIADNGGEGDPAALSAFGKHWGSADMFKLARQANENPPKLKTLDAKGYRRDFIEFHPAYHELMAASVAVGLQASTWRDDATPAAAPAQVTRAARFYMAAQVETGHLCPITMTRAAVAALAVEPPLVAKLMPKIVSRRYDDHFRPWWEKTGITLGMGMTEKQGGTDVRGPLVRAMRSMATNGSCRHRCATPFWCSRRRRAALRVS
jgi:putative acyl-CoA dehydrogenase